MSDDITIPAAALTGSGRLLAVFFGWLKHNGKFKTIDDKFGKLESKIEDGDKNAALLSASVAQNLATFQLEAEKRYAKDEPIQATLARLHDRLDVTATKEEMKEVRDDIKKLLVKAGVAWAMDIYERRHHHSGSGLDRKRWASCGVFRLVEAQWKVQNHRR